jgi:hypothetical protein
LGRPTIATKPDLNAMDSRIVRLCGAVRKARWELVRSAVSD